MNNNIDFSSVFQAARMTTGYYSSCAEIIVTSSIRCKYNHSSSTIPWLFQSPNALHGKYNQKKMANTIRKKKNENYAYSFSPFDYYVIIYA